LGPIRALLEQEIPNFLMRLLLAPLHQAPLEVHPGLLQIQVPSEMAVESVLILALVVL
jgi:hypothetical protein